MGWRSELGGSPFASSIAVIPKDQMSAYKKIYFFNINLLTPISDKTCNFFLSYPNITQQIVMRTFNIIR